MSLASELHSIVARFRTRVAEQVNSGQLLTIDQHLERLASVAEADIQAAENVAHRVLGELYTALHAATSGAPADPAPAAPAAGQPASAPAPAPAPAAPAADGSAPAPSSAKV